MVEVRECSFLEFGTFKELPALVSEYAAESAIDGLPTPRYVEENYLALERAGLAQLFIATFEGALIGFVIVVVTVNARYNVPVAAFEAFFVAHAHRKRGAGNRLKRVAEQAAKERGAMGVLIGAPIGSRLERALSYDRMYRETNRVFFRSLADD